MKKYCIFAACIIMLSAFNSCRNEIKKNKGVARVQIDYGNKKLHTFTIPMPKTGLTALEALQHVADISTRPVSNHVFVTSVNGVQGKRGEMGWYYEVNNKPADMLAIRKSLRAGDTARWIYKTDVCSRTVDKE